MERRIPLMLAATAMLGLSVALVTAPASDAAQAPAATRDVHSCALAPPGYATCFAEFVAHGQSGLLVRPHVAAVRRSAQPRRPRAFAAALIPAPADDAEPTSEPAATAEPSPSSPAYLQQAYDLTSLSATGGSGETVAIVDAYDDPTAESDLATYRGNFGLPACTSANGCFRKVNQAGNASNYPAANSAWSEEIALDLDAVSALCPNCHITLVEATTSSWLNLEAAEQTAASLGATQISDSWGTLSASAPPPTGTIFSPPGVDVVAGAGDSGYSGSGTGGGGDFYPAALPSVTAAGATTLNAGSAPTGARDFNETTWTLGGSGCDLNVAQPAWQQGSACPGRAYADISADGNPQTGLDVYATSAGGWVLAGGTSLSTPLVAAYYAVTGVPATTPAWAYSHAALLNDVLSGVNGTCAASLAFICTAGVGFDGPTGNGSISGDVVTGAPGIDGPAQPGGSATAGTASAQLQASVYANGLSTSVWWEYGPTASYGLTTPATAIGAGPGVSATAANINGLAATSTYHYRLVAANADGTSYGYDQSFATVSPTAAAPPATAPPQLAPAASVTSASTSSSVSYNTTPPRNSPSTRASSGGSPSGGQVTIKSVTIGRLPARSSSAKATAASRGQLIVKLDCSKAGSCGGTLIVTTAGGAALGRRTLALSAGEVATVRLSLSARSTRRLDGGAHRPRLLVHVLAATAARRDRVR